MGDGWLDSEMMAVTRGTKQVLNMSIFCLCQREGTNYSKYRESAEFEQLAKFIDSLHHCLVALRGKGQ